MTVKMVDFLIFTIINSHSVSFRSTSCILHECKSNHCYTTTRLKVKTVWEQTKKTQTSSNVLSHWLPPADGRSFLSQQQLPIRLLLTTVQHGRVRSKLQHQQTDKWSRQRYVAERRPKATWVSREPHRGRFSPETAKEKCKAEISACTWKAGLGAVLLQYCGDRWRALAYTSRGLTSSEFNFTQTEKEPLVLWYACA